MKNKKIFAFITSLFIFLAYTLFCFRPLKTELQLTPDWTAELTDTIQDNSTSLKALPFKLGQNVGYFTHDGHISLLKNFDYKATISSEYFAMYSQNSKEFEIYNPKGEVVGKIEDGGFPYITGSRIFLLLPGGAGFEAKERHGKTIMRYQHTSPITALNSNDVLTIAGFADGTLCIFDKDFNIQHKLAPGGSDIEVILGANVSKNGNYFASVSGQNKQRFALYKTEENHAKIIFHKFLEKNIVHQTFVYFSNDEYYVYYNDADGLGIVNCKNFKYSHIDIPGVILNIQESPVANSLFVISKEKQNGRNMYTITVIEEKTHKTGSFSFESQSAFILTDENSLFIGKDAKISKLTVSKE